MSNLQIGLAIIGGLVLAAVVAYNAWITRQSAPRTARERPVPLPAADTTDPVAEVGERMLDPLADRLLMVVGLIGLLLLARFPWPAPTIILLRDVASIAGFAWLARRGILMEIDFAGKVSSGFNMGCVAVGLAISATWVDTVFWCAVGLSVLTFLNYVAIAVGRVRAQRAGEMTSTTT